MAEPSAYLVTRLPGAPPRRAGRVWPVGVSAVDLCAAEVAVIAADPGYLIVAVGTPTAVGPSAAAAAAGPAEVGVPRGRKRRGPA
jgi:hypothetical protein